MRCPYISVRSQQASKDFEREAKPKEAKPTTLNEDKTKKIEKNERKRNKK